jgi:RNA polymerase sigma-70 factor (ECF subfamily)
VPEKAELARFEQVVLPHLAAAYNLARWITGNDHDAEDVVQESYLRALRFFGGFRGENSRPWLLTIVRNTCFTWLRQNRFSELSTELDEEIHASETEPGNPESMLLAAAQSEMVRKAIEELPPEFREVIILREMEDLSYKEIAAIASIPVGTVMSRLARARSRLQELLSGPMTSGVGA